ncbi:MAG: hypothetical protein JRM73_02820 [Nitrososphaerota archaeon]|nr:hypothetical protein [Nitrososphaerota archaeon]
MLPAAEVFGLAGGFFVALGMVPQVVRVWRMKDAREISLAFILLTITGTLLWLAYGFFLDLFSVMLWNSINFCLQAALLAVKLRYGMNPQAHGVR